MNLTAGSLAAQQVEAVKIITFGDSTTLGYSVKNSYPRQLRQSLQKQGITATVINSGVNGDTTSGAAERLERDVLAHDPDLVIIQFGLNDQTMRLYQDPRDMESYVSSDDYVTNLRRFVSKIQKRNCQVMLMTPNPMCWTDTLERHYPQGPFLDPPNGGNLLLERYAQAVRELAQAEGVPLVDVFLHFSEYEKKTGGNIQYLFLDDGVHPNEYGYRLIVDQLIPYVLQCVKGDLFLDRQ